MVSCDPFLIGFIPAATQCAPRREGTRKDVNNDRDDKDEGDVGKHCDHGAAKPQ